MVQLSHKDSLKGKNEEGIETICRTLNIIGKESDYSVSNNTKNW